MEHVAIVYNLLKFTSANGKNETHVRASKRTRRGGASLFGFTFANLKTTKINKIIYKQRKHDDVWSKKYQIEQFARCTP